MRLSIPIRRLPASSIASLPICAPRSSKRSRANWARRNKHPKDPPTRAHLMIKHASHALGEVRPLTPAEIQDLSVALRELAFTGTVIPQRLIRRDATHTWGSTLEALPAALDLLGDERDGVVVGLLRQFERAVTDNLNHMRNRDRSKPFDFDRGISAR